jgi:peptidyl-prolyl cis-trans isomerase A (cyclophilin A)
MIPTSTRAALAAVAALAALAACTIGPSPTPRPECPSAAPTADEATAILADADQAVLATSQGDFTIQLYGEQAPIAAANFVALARCGFYDGITFHRVIAGFVIQAGDPQTKSNRGDFDGLGSGGPGYRFEVEFPPDELTYDIGTVAMANAMQYDFESGEIFSGTDTNGSQFFIDLVDLDERDGWRRYYTIFGTVGTGGDVVAAIGSVPTNGDPRNVPLEPVIIESITIQPEAPASPSPG